MPKIKRGDTKPGATITCKVDGVLADWTQADTVRLLGKLGGSLVIDRVIAPSEPGIITIESWEPTDTANTGKLQIEVEVTWLDGEKTTFPGDKYLEVDIIPDLG